MTYPTPTIPPIGQEIEAKPQSVTASGGSDTPVSWTVRPLSGSQQSELDVETSGTDIPGVFAKLCWMFRRSQIYALSVKAGTHCGRFHFDGKYRGFNEHIESATKMLTGHPLFPTTRKPYLAMASSSRSARPTRSTTSRPIPSSPGSSARRR